jgi:HEAT repeat protein
MGLSPRPLWAVVFAALAVIYHPDALEPLLIGLKDELPDVRDEVMGGLRYQLQFGAARKDERVFAALLVALDDSNDAVRAKAAGALGTMRTKGYDRMLPHLIGATRSASRIVVQAAIDGLTALGDPRAADRLFELADTPAFVRRLPSPTWGTSGPHRSCGRWSRNETSTRYPPWPSCAIGSRRRCSSTCLPVPRIRRTPPWRMPSARSAIPARSAR